MSADLVTYSRAAQVLGARPQTIPDLVEAWRLTPKGMAHNGKAKGLDGDDMRILRRALNRPARRARPVAL